MRRVIAIVLSLAAASLTALVSPAEEVSPHCAEHQASAPGDTEQCEVTGRQSDVGVGTFEPTMHAAPDGGLYYAKADGNGVAIGFGAGVMRSLDGGDSWTDVTPRVGGVALPPETNDPYVYVDHITGRVFSFHMSPILLCSILSFSDDQGESWTTNPYGCGPTGVWDHQTIVASPSRGTPTVGYPNVLVQCVNAIYAAVCARSLDGGMTWSDGVPAYLNRNIASGCGAQHGHLVSAPDGTIYLPTSECGTVPSVFISRDDGLTWEQSVIANVNVPFTDPSVAVDAENNVYASYVDESGALFLATSTDGGESWSEPVQAAPDAVTSTMPAMTVGDPGNVAIAYPGTDDLPERWGTDFSDDEWRQVEWGGFISFTTDAFAADPLFQTVETTGDDPLERGRACVKGGRCAFQVDFIEATIAPDGTVWASLADGCTLACAVTDGADNNERYGQGVAITLDDISLCETRCGRFPAEAVAVPEAVVPPAPSDPRAPDVIVDIDEDTAQQLRDLAAHRRLVSATGSTELLDLDLRIDIR